MSTSICSILPFAYNAKIFAGRRVAYLGSCLNASSSPFHQPCFQTSNIELFGLHASMLNVTG